MNLITINGVALPPPTSYKVSQSDLDSSDSGRSESGIMQRNRIRKGIAKIQLEWKKLTTTQMATVLLAVEGESFTVKYFFGSEKTAKMYAGDKEANLCTIDAHGKSYWDVSYNVIEF